VEALRKNEEIFDRDHIKNIQKNHEILNRDHINNIQNNIYTGNGRGRGSGKMIFFGFKADASNKAFNNFFFLNPSAPSK
jgi:hypothetical protein